MAHISDDSSVDAKILELTRSLRRQRMILFALVGLIAIMALGGAAEPQGVSDELATKHLRIVDNDGKTRIEAKITQGGTVALLMSDQNHMIRSAITLTQGGESCLTISNKNGQQAITVAVDAGGVPSIHVMDSNKKIRIGAALAENHASLALFDGDEKARVRASVSTDGKEVVLDHE